MVQKPDGRRARSIETRARLLDAAEQVVRRDGVGSLTLNRVAAEADISKGGLLYHFASKQDLVSALLTHTLDNTEDRLQELADDADPRADGRFATAYLDYVRSADHTRRGAATGIFAAAALDEGDLAPARARFAAWQDRLLTADGISSDTALLARIVGDGLWLIDLFDLAPPSTAQRQAVLDLVQARIDAETASR